MPRAGLNRPHWRQWAAAACLLGSAVALGAAPLLMPDSYSWLVNTTSESAAQRLTGAWLARLGFLLFGLGVLWVSSLAASGWGRWGQLLHSSFGVFMLATAAFSHSPFEPGVAFDRTEDSLHSVSATAMGFAFAFGVIAVALRRRRPALGRRVFDVVAVASSVFIPLGMATLTEYSGLLQRTMFLIAYVWYAIEALQRTPDASRIDPAESLQSRLNREQMGSGSL